MTFSADETFRRALASLQEGKANDAERLFKKLLRAQPRHIGGLNLFSILLTQLERFEEAEHYVRLALNENATSDATFYNYGIILKALGRPTEALERFSQALAINASVAETWNNRGTVFNDLRSYGEAIADFDKAISLNPNYPDAFCNRGRSLAELKLYEQSLIAYDKALALKPDFAEAWLGRGIIFTGLNRYNDAFAAYDRALTLKPRLAEAWLGRGNAVLRLKGAEEALATYDRALAIQPDFAEGHYNRGLALQQLKRFREASSSFDKALALDPRHRYAFSELANSTLNICDFRRIAKLASEIATHVKERKSTIMPLVLMGYCGDPSLQLQCARNYVQDLFPVMPDPLWDGRVWRRDKIRIAYLSADFREHALAYLMVELFELHDRSGFEVLGLSFGPDDGSGMRSRLVKAFDQFDDVRWKSDREVAELLLAHEVDIAVDLTGHTLNARPGILAHRPAPVQVQYLGFLGTMGADFIDYAIADPIVAPFDHQPFYTERIVHLPDCHQVNDSGRITPARTPTRQDAGLPKQGFVFCCFNNNLKISAPVFDVWMRLLKSIEGSVLWLVRDNDGSEKNLRQAAAARGVDPSRLIFAGRVSLDAHVARQRLADLFLDTVPVNAGATASEALRADLPLLTCLGQSFAGRVGASLLHAIGMPELVTNSAEEYEAVALKLASDPPLLQSLRRKLEQNRLCYPLFDGDRFRRHIEAAYRIMRERTLRGEPPKSFAVDAIEP